MVQLVLPRPLNLAESEWLRAGLAVEVRVILVRRQVFLAACTSWRVSGVARSTWSCATAAEVVWESGCAFLVKVTEGCACVLRLIPTNANQPQRSGKR